MNPKSDLILKYKSNINVTVAWGDMDAAQHVNNIMYLRYLESARIQYMEDIQFEFGQTSIGIILAEVNVQYRIPVTFPDTLWVGTRTLLDTVDENSLWTDQVIFSEKHQKIATLCKARLVCYDYEKLQKASWPEEVMKNLLGYENSSQ